MENLLPAPVLLSAPSWLLGFPFPCADRVILPSRDVHHCTSFSLAPLMADFAAVGSLHCLLQGVLDWGGAVEVNKEEQRGERRLVIGTVALGQRGEGWLVIGTVAFGQRGEGRLVIGTVALVQRGERQLVIKTVVLGEPNPQHSQAEL